MSKNVIETIIGALVLILAFTFLYFAYKTTDLSQNNEQSYSVVAKFDRADGLNVGSDVKISGVKVGKVISQSLDKKTYQAIVTMLIHNDINIPTDSIAEIIGNGLLGEKYIALVPGSEEEYLKENGVVQFTQSSISFESLIAKFMFNSAQGNQNQKSAPTTDSESQSKKS